MGLLSPVLRGALRGRDPYPGDPLALDFAGVGTGGRQFYKRNGVIVPRFEMLPGASISGGGGRARVTRNAALSDDLPDGALPVGDRGLFTPSARGSRWVDNRGLVPATTWPSVNNATRTAGTKSSPVPGALPVLITTTGASGLIQRNVTVPNDSLRRSLTLLIERKVVTYAITLGLVGGTSVTSPTNINGATGSMVGARGTIRPFNADWWRVDIFLDNNSTGNTTLFTTVALVGASGQTAEVVAPRVSDGGVIYDPLMVTTLVTDARTAILPKAPLADAQMLIDAEADFGGATLAHAVNGSGGGLRLYRSAGLLYAVSQTASAENTPVEVGRWPAGMGALIEVERDGAEYLIGLHGKPAVSVAAAEACSEITLGSNSAGTSAWNANISRLRQSATQEPAGVYDDFDRADGAIGDAWTGQPWVQVPAGVSPGVIQATISGGALVAAASAHSAHAAYNGIDMIGDVREMRASKSFGAGTNGGAVALIANPAGLTSIANITAKSIHIVFTNVSVDVGFFENNAYDIEHTFNYEAACLTDGTVYDFGWRIEGETMFLMLPTGSIMRVTDPRIATFGGRYATFEHYWVTGQCVPKIHAAFAR